MKAFDEQQRDRAAELLRCVEAFTKAGRPAPGHLLRLLAKIGDKALAATGMSVTAVVVRAKQLVQRLDVPAAPRADAPEITDPRGAP